MNGMRLLRRSAIFILLVLFACQSHSLATIRIIDGTAIHTLTTAERRPAALLSLAGVSLGPGDVIIANAAAVTADQPLADGPGYTLQVIRAGSISVNGRKFTTSAGTVGAALSAAGAQLYAADGMTPGPDTPLTPGLQIKYTPSVPLTVTAEGVQYRIRSAAGTVGAALAQAGLPLLGLDLSQPPENSPLPSDGQIHLSRVSESIALAFQSIPFGSQSVDSPDVELGQQQILQPGLPGLAVARTRIQYQDGREISRESESQSVVNPPQARIVGNGTKVVLHTAQVGGVSIQYWRAIQMYATVYSPCNSATASGGCSSGTASGLPAGKGVVAVDPSIYHLIAGQRLYIPGYGYAVVGDIGGGYIIENKLGISRTRWIDLGFDDNNLVDMTGWVTVYFLAPAPAVIPDFLK
jgi:resuscitation-promoting factor RpfB